MKLSPTLFKKVLCWIFAFLITGFASEAQLLIEWSQLRDGPGANWENASFPLASQTPSPFILEPYTQYRLAFQNLPLFDSSATTGNPNNPYGTLTLDLENIGDGQQPVAVNISQWKYINGPGFEFGLAPALFFMGPGRSGQLTFAAGWSPSPELIGSGSTNVSGFFTINTNDRRALLHEVTIKQFEESRVYQASFVPEPSSLSLLLVGGAVAIARLRKS